MESLDPSLTALKARLVAAAAASPSLTRSEGRRSFRLLLVAIMVAEVTLFELAGGLAHSRDRPLILTVGLAYVWALAAATMTWLTVRLGSPFVRDAEVLGLACVTLPVALWALMTLTQRYYPEPIVSPEGPWCFFATLAGAVGPLGAFLHGRRRSEPERPGLLGAAAGCSAGAWAGVPVLLWCPSATREHALAFHVAPMVAMALVGAIVGAQVLRLARR
jgi:hypothetical protein